MIEMNDVSFNYAKTTKPTLKNINFKVEAGEIFGFLGPSGSGKSTTQKVLIGILEGYQGSAKIGGKEIREKNNDFYEKIGVSYELPNIYSKLTGIENLKFISNFYRGKTVDPLELLRMVKLDESAHIKASQYSKGMKMRLNFARAFINDPDLLILDEPTSGLDPTNAKLVKDIILQSKARGKTIFLTTHNMTIAEELCDRVALIVDGRIKLIDSPKHLKVEHGERKVKIEYMKDGNISCQEFNMDGIGDNREFSTCLKENDKMLTTIHSKDATLEDIFIKVTGRRLV